MTTDRLLKDCCTALLLLANWCDCDINRSIVKDTKMRWSSPCGGWCAAAPSCKILFFSEGTYTCCCCGNMYSAGRSLKWHTVYDWLSGHRSIDWAIVASSPLIGISDSPTLECVLNKQSLVTARVTRQTDPLESIVKGPDNGKIIVCIALKLERIRGEIKKRNKSSPAKAFNVSGRQWPRSIINSCNIDVRRVILSGRNIGRVANFLNFR